MDNVLYVIINNVFSRVIIILEDNHEFNILILFLSKSKTPLVIN